MTRTLPFASLLVICGCYAAHELSEPPDSLARPLEEIPVALAAGLEHTCAVLSGGRLECWGGGGERRTIRDSNVLAVAAGRGTCWLNTDETIECTPFGFSGRLFSVDAGVIASGGTTRFCVLERDGLIRCQGWECRSERCETTQPFEGRYIDVAAGRDHVCALDERGTIRCWGDGSSGQLSGPAEPWLSRPREVVGLPRASAIATGNEHTCALSGGAVYCWGRNAEGQLGDGLDDHEICTDPRSMDSFDCSTQPVRVAEIETAVEVAVGTFHSCALLRDGSTRCWGSNGFGRLGDGVSDHGRTCGDADCSFTPVKVGVEDAESLAVGFSHACVLNAEGDVHCWGSNLRGQLGGAPRVSSGQPLLVP